MIFDKIEKLKLHTNNKQVDISLIIPFYNTEKYLSESIESALAQNGQSMEIILVNDGSIDRSSDIAKKYSEEYENVLLFETDNHGPGHARNFGVKKARGRYIAFLDADDILVPGIYKRMLTAADNNGADMCICNVARVNTKGIWGSDLHNMAYNNYNVLTNISETTELVYDTCSVNKLFRRDFYLGNDLRFPEKVVYEDISFNLNAHLKSKKVIMMAETGYLWRARDEADNPSITQKFFSEKNRKDRFAAATAIIEMVNNSDASERLRQAIQYKILEIDLRIILSSVEYVSAEEAESVFNDARQFIDKYIDQNVIEMLPIIDIQRIRLVQEGNIAAYKALLDYKRKYYEHVKAEEKDKIIYANLPSEFFTVKKRTLNDEFERKTRRVWIDDICITEEGITVYAHAYIRRYNMAKEDDQKIEIQLVNEETNSSITIKGEPFPTHFLTEKFGKEEDKYSGEEHRYNYDFTGFKFSIDYDTFDGQEGNSKKIYSAIALYKDRLFSGKEILRGVDDRKLKRYEAISLKAKTGHIEVKIGAQKELQFVLYNG